MFGFVQQLICVAFDKSYFFLGLESFGQRVYCYDCKTNKHFCGRFEEQKLGNIQFGSTFLSWQTSLLCVVGELAGDGLCLWLLGWWQMICYRGQVIGDTLQVTHLSFFVKTFGIFLVQVLQSTHIERFSVAVCEMLSKRCKICEILSKSDYYIF